MSTVGYAARRRLGLATICVDPGTLEQLRDALRSVPGAALGGELTSYMGGPGEARTMEALARHRPEVCVVDLDSDLERAVRTIEHLRDAFPSMVLFATSSDSKPETIIQVMQNGCTEFLVKPIVRERVIEALEKIERKRRGPVRESRVCVLIGAKGGTGVTTLATHLGVYTAQMGAKSLLIDQHVDLGDVSVYLGFGSHQYHFYELVNNTHRLDAELLQGFLLRHNSGLDVVPSPESFSASVHMPAPSAFAGTIAFLRSLYDVIFVDCAPGLSGLNLTMIDAADVLYLVSTPELPSIRKMVRCFEHLTQFNCPDEKIQVVVNRYAKRAAITEAQIERATHRKISMLVPNNYPEVINAIHSGTAVPPDSKSELAVALRQWAASLIPATRTEHAGAKPEPKRRFSILGI